MTRLLAALLRISLYADRHVSADGFRFQVHAGGGGHGPACRPWECRRFARFADALRWRVYLDFRR